MWNRARPDLRIAVAFFVALMAFAIYLNFPQPVAGNMEFGYEHGNIADALARGDGFSDPFRSSSSPTAWMPPAYPTLIAGIFKVFGLRSVASAWCLLTFKYLGLSLALFLLLRAAEKLPYPQHRRVAIPVIFGLMLALYRDLTFLSVTDSWLNILLASAVIHALGVAIYDEGSFGAYELAVLGALLPMANPIMGFAAVVILGVSALLSWRRKDGLWRSAQLARTALFLVCFAATTSAWTYRNYQVFGSIILVKSNLAYDYYQANFMDDDGVISHATLRNNHPIAPNPQRDAYIAQGEAAFLADYKAKVKEEMPKAGVAVLARKAFNRALNAFVYTQDPADLEEVTTVGGLRGMARKVKTVSRGILVAGAPFLAMLLCLWDPAMRRSMVFLTATLAYVVDLGPHVLVTHYARYQEPLVIIQVLFLYGAVAKALAWRAKGAQAADVVMRGDAWQAPV